MKCFRGKREEKEKKYEKKLREMLGIDEEIENIMLEYAEQIIPVAEQIKSEIKSGNFKVIRDEAGREEYIREGKEYITKAIVDKAVDEALEEIRPHNKFEEYGPIIGMAGIIILLILTVILWFVLIF